MADPYLQPANIRRALKDLIEDTEIIMADSVNVYRQLDAAVSRGIISMDRITLGQVSIRLVFINKTMIDQRKVLKNILEVFEKAVSGR